MTVKTIVSRKAGCRHGSSQCELWKPQSQHWQSTGSVLSYRSRRRSARDRRLSERDIVRTFTKSARMRLQPNGSRKS